jgi:predicted Fe-Mo cluster-binding NifX family protein
MHPLDVIQSGPSKIKPPICLIILHIYNFTIRLAFSLQYYLTKISDNGGILNMIIGLTTWGQRISPVFDSAQNLMLVNAQGSKITSRRYEKIKLSIPLLLSEKLKAFKIEVLICGAISKELADIIESVSIHCIPFITGNAEIVLNAYIKGEILTSKFIMPGCGKSRNTSGRGNGQGRRHGKGHVNVNYCGSKYKYEIKPINIKES